jgi:hypothetical protein
MPRITDAIQDGDDKKEHTILVHEGLETSIAIDGDSEPFIQLMFFTTRSDGARRVTKVSFLTEKHAMELVEDLKRKIVTLMNR